MSMTPDMGREYIEMCLTKYHELEQEKRKEFIRQIMSYYDYYNQMITMANSWGMGITEMFNHMEKVRDLFKVK